MERAIIRLTITANVEWKKNINRKTERNICTDFSLAPQTKRLSNNHSNLEKKIKIQVDINYLQNLFNVSEI